MREMTSELLLPLLSFVSIAHGFPKPGKSEIVLSPEFVSKVQYGSMVMSLDPGAIIAFGGLCDDPGNSDGSELKLSYRLVTSHCAGLVSVQASVLADPNMTVLSAATPWASIPAADCSLNTINPVSIAESPAWQKLCQISDTKSHKKLKMPSPGKLRMATACSTRNKDVHAIVFRAEVARASTSGGKKIVRLRVEMRNTWGYLSAVDRHSYVFYQCMTSVYSAFAMVWMLLMLCQWRDLLQLQFWIAGVITVGMFEKALFLASYHTVNENGSEGEFLILAAELISAIKRTLARLLIIVVSAGFGIVKSRLGAIRPYVVLVGAVFFLLSTSEGMHRSSFHAETSPPRSYHLLLLALIVLDTAILVWVFTLLHGTIASLAMRRNKVKLSLYNNFVQVLFVTTLLSATFLLIWAWKVSPMRCRKNWSLLWLEHGFWHILFSCILLTIMFLWRPTANNARYAYSANTESSEEEALVQDHVGTSDGIKLRSTKSGQVPQRANSTADDELRWVEENIPSALAGGILDDEEAEARAAYEVSKMQ